ncbi:2-oxoglutarate dehydrogenase E2 component [Ardenticatena maritima]|uniref:Dihydrolipoamide acetyltransferase component of pyruvate dehydrogenase complex n=1 Tax=Ardenticatena maritima TaxID=872965 RepID=A0A0M9UBQ4_9CHLR|nr:dihydrolipoamide acetyltransferase family protein [Ardenticatena maritima]KPL89450.1 dehydrogenase [Ardenticatena maritima]GAP62104.1 2-oxoglutarate dehydrogenase E2 component [Ardenticatena maritima]
MATPIKMPQLGESVTEGTVGKWLKKVGEHVEKYEPLLEVISDKVDTEVTSTVSGVVLSIEVPEGETVPVGTVLAWVGEPGEKPGENGSAPAEAPAAPQPAAASTSATAPKPAADKSAAQRISPVVARLAAEHNIDLSQIQGSGRGGRITKKDVLRYLEEREKAAAQPAQPAAPQPAAPPPPKPAPAPEPPAPLPMTTAADVPLPSGEGELVPLTPMRKAIAEHMVRSKHTSPHVTTVHEVDLSRVVAHRNKHKAAFAAEGVRLTYTAYFVEAVAQTLKKHPMVNSTFTDQGILLKRAINIGVATAVQEGKGLLVPVLKHADELSLKGIARALGDLTERARSGKLTPDDVQGGTFTITNYGTNGAIIGTPIINQPQAAILGVGAMQKRVVVVEQDGMDAIAIRPMAYLTLTFDHRILDGAAADAFMRDLVAYLQNYPL